MTPGTAQRYEVQSRRVLGESGEASGLEQAELSRLSISIVEP